MSHCSPGQSVSPYIILFNRWPLCPFLSQDTLHLGNVDMCPFDKKMIVVFQVLCLFLFRDG